MRYLMIQADCDETSSCTCKDCSEIQMLVTRIRARKDSNQITSTLEQFLEAREHDLPIQKTLHQSLMDFLATPAPIHPRIKQIEEAGQEIKETFYQIAASKEYWSMLPHIGGFTVSKITPAGYQDHTWYAGIDNARAHLGAIGARRTFATQPKLMTESLRFKLINAMSDAYRQFKNGEMSREVYDRITRELSVTIGETGAL